MTQGSNELHFFYDAQNKPAVVVYNGSPYSYVKNLQGDIVAIIDSSYAIVVKYKYDAWGRPISCTGIKADSLGKLNPFRYRGYVYDEETGLYYLRSRYYHPTWDRFINADCIINTNLFSYCENNVVQCFDDNGTDTQFFLDYGYPITTPVLKRNEFGSHSIDEKIPQQYMISALIQMANDSNLNNRAWIYHHTLDYGQADCNSVVRMVCKSYYTRAAYFQLELGSLVDTVVGALKTSEPIPITDPNAIPPCSIVISEDYSHMGVTIGPYRSSTNAVVESAVRFGGVNVTERWKVGKGSREFFYYCQLSVVDYNSGFSHTGSRYLTVEDESY